MNYLSHAFHCKQRRAHINDIDILNSLLFYITGGQHNIVLVLTTSTVLILICYVLIIILAAYLVSFLNLLNRVQSCNKNHLLLGPNCEEDHPLMKAFFFYFFIFLFFYFFFFIIYNTSTTYKMLLNTVQCLHYLQHRTH